MSLQTRSITCVLIFLIKLYHFPATADVSGTSAPSCSPVVKAPACPSGYIETPKPRACVRVSQQHINLADGVRYCDSVEPPYSSMWVSYNAATLAKLKAIAKKEVEGVLAGLTDKQREGSWLWSNGQKLRPSSASWASNEPNGQRNENCVFVKTDGTFADLSCTGRRPVLCMVPHQIAFREIQMSLNSHAPKRHPHLIYKGRSVTFTCSAFMEEGDNVYIDYPEVKTVTYTQNVLTVGLARTNSLGMCTNVESTEIIIPNGRIVPAHLPSNIVWFTRTFDCYTRTLDSLDIRGGGGCRNKTSNEFCRKFIIPVIRLDPPIQNTTLNITVIRDTVKAVCSVNVGATGQLTWVLYYWNETQVLQNGDPRIQNATRVPVTNSNRWQLQGTLLLEYEVEKGIDVGVGVGVDVGVGCFDHNITMYSLSTTCDPGGMFCGKRNVTILPWTKPDPKDTEEASSYTWIIIIIALILIGASAGIGFMTAKQRRSTSRSIAGDNADPIEEKQSDVAEDQQSADDQEQPDGDEDNQDDDEGKRMSQRMSQ